MKGFNAKTPKQFFNEAQEAAKLILDNLKKLKEEVLDKDYLKKDKNWTSIISWLSETKKNDDKLRRPKRHYFDEVPSNVKPVDDFILEVQEKVESYIKSNKPIDNDIIEYVASRYYLNYKHIKFS